MPQYTTMEYGTMHTTLYATVDCRTINRPYVSAQYDPQRGLIEGIPQAYRSEMLRVFSAMLAESSVHVFPAVCHLSDRDIDTVVTVEIVCGTVGNPSPCIRVTWYVTDHGMTYLSLIHGTNDAIHWASEHVDMILRRYYGGPELHSLLSTRDVWTKTLAAVVSARVDTIIITGVGLGTIPPRLIEGEHSVLARGVISTSSIDLQFFLQNTDL